MSKEKFNLSHFDILRSMDELIKLICEHENCICDGDRAKLEDHDPYCPYPIMVDIYNAKDDFKAAMQHINIFHVHVMNTQFRYCEICGKSDIELDIQNNKIKKSFKNTEDFGYKIRAPFK